MARSLRRRARFVANAPSGLGILPRWVPFAAVMCLSVLLVGCADPGSDNVVLTADLPLHLEDHLDVAAIVGSEVPVDLPEPVEWRFDEPQPGWQSAFPFQSGTKPAKLLQKSRLTGRVRSAARWMAVAALVVVSMQAGAPSFAAVLENLADRVETVAPPLAQGLDAVAVLVRSFPPSLSQVDDP